jgi:hypothetical protein
MFSIVFNVLTGFAIGMIVYAWEMTLCKIVNTAIEEAFQVLLNGVEKSFRLLLKGIDEALGFPQSELN